MSLGTGSRLNLGANPGLTRADLHTTGPNYPNSLVRHKREILRFSWQISEHVFGDTDAFIKTAYNATIITGLIQGGAGCSPCNASIIELGGYSEAPIRGGGNSKHHAWCSEDLG